MTGTRESHQVKRFELLEHTADVAMVAYGKSLPEAFANAAYGMFSIIVDVDTIREVESQMVTVKADDVEMLLVEWLNQLLFTFEVNRLVFKRFDVREFSDLNLVATCYGEKYDRERHGSKLGIKAATYHMLKVDPKTNQVRVIFDV
ncbi:MAG: archease [Chloroflexi bacterium]|nr:archease [Chloroflexota bacterium]